MRYFVVTAVLGITLTFGCAAQRQTDTKTATTSVEPCMVNGKSYECASLTRSARANPVADGCRHSSKCSPEKCCTEDGSGCACNSCCIAVESPEAN
jgi:hypothetical protein